MEKTKFHILTIDSSQTYDWLLNKHYAKRIPSISYSFGLYDDKNIMQGVITFGKPASPALCDGVCGVENREYVYELNRLCVNDNLPKNTLSFFVGKALKALPDLIIVSYADTSQNHNGYIYQATNWIYTGLSAKRTDRIDESKPNKHGRHNKTGELKDRPRKHRYIQFTGNKRKQKKWVKALNYKIETYPKGENKRYDTSYTPNVQTRLF